MSGFYWNIHGFNKLKKQSVVREWINKNALKFGCIIETRVKERRMKRIVSYAFPHWSAISNYDYHRLGKLWVVWSPEVRVTPCFKSSEMITVSVLLDGMVEEFLVSFVYASNCSEERKELWNDLKDHQDTTMLVSHGLLLAILMRFWRWMSTWGIVFHQLHLVCVISKML